jgi:rfaE bifunctional protein nucleotidyltransferase chain/domain
MCGVELRSHLVAHFEALLALESHLERLQRWGERLAASLLDGGRLLACGNGGSAAEAEHLVAELVGRFGTERRALSAIALGGDAASLTGVANDYGWSEGLARLVDAHGRAGDVLVALSTSGTSENVLAAARAASAFVAAGEPSRLPGCATGMERALALAAGVRARAGGVVATGGCFDLLHAGHVSTLVAARALGDCLVVLLNSDASVRALKGPRRPIVTESDRAAVLSALACVDAVVTFDEPTPVEALRRLRPDVFVKGGDYAGRDLTERAVLAELGGMVALLPYLEGRSTSRLVNGLGV